MAEGIQPIFILPEGYNRTSGKDAQRNNIAAAKAVANAVKSTLGPRGMDKMLVDNIGDITITNDGVTVLKSMEIENPAAKMIVEVAKTQEEEVGDGTTTAVIIAGELLKNAETLLDQSIHPTLVARGYRLAANKAQEILDKIKLHLDIANKEDLSRIVKTAIVGKSTGADTHIVSLIVDAVQHVKSMSGKNDTLDLDDIKVEKKVGGGLLDSRLIKGVIIDKEKVHPDMPEEIKNAKVALLNLALEIEKTNIDAQIRIEKPEQLQAFLDEEENMLKEMVEKIKASGANVVIVQKGIDDTAQHFLSKAGILAFRRVSENDMKKIGKATGAKVVATLDELGKDSLGEAGIVHVEKLAGETLALIEECKNPKAVTILVRGGTEHVVDEIQRAIDDSLGDLKSVIEDGGSIVAGGGAAELEVSKNLRDFATGLEGREQLAVNAFADALEVVPKTLAENAGLDPIDILVELRAEHQKGKTWAGVNLLDVYKPQVSDMYKEGVIEPLRTKKQAIKSASEVAVMILRIDDIIAAGKSANQQPQMPPGGMGGYGD
ncbi:MAG: thermosome subunit beta [Candidatus Parvarchaeota archaeon]|nr:TCP-1/cpn60 chaperonin family protein [Candidatus Parvarchaeota archaeon]MCW1295512.1 thermosome subunit beta [Candidatus Parvarchaeum tengchongense]MCW1311978.1 thermosome subunit beta [Candidatus Parvarchaeum tengchongense]